MALTVVDGGMLSATNAQYTMFKNRLINGGMNIWQRGTTTVNPQAGNANFYTADRWACNRANNVTGITVSQSTNVPSGFKYSLKLQRVAANAALDALYLFNSNESINTLDLAGETITLSFWAKSGANYSGGALNVVLNSGTGTDQPVYGYTGSNSFASSTPTLTTTWTRYTLTATVPSNATELGSFFYWTPTGTAGADDAVYFTGFQLEKGSTATAFDYRPYGTELSLCQRYFEKSNNTETVVPTNASGGYTFFSSAAIVNGAQWGWQIYKVTKRTFATINVYSYTSSTSNTVSGGSGSDLAANSGVTISQNQVGFWLSNNSGGTITPAVGGFIFQWKADAEL